jgi:hypothetical protein
MFYHAINSGTINTKNSIQVGVRERDGVLERDSKS